MIVEGFTVICNKCGNTWNHTNKQTRTTEKLNTKGVYLWCGCGNKTFLVKEEEIPHEQKATTA
jgi:RNase P subunit RPR2